MHAHDVLYYGHKTFQRAYQRFPANDMERAGACGEWSVKDLIAHITSFEWLLADGIQFLTGSTATPYLQEFTQARADFNAIQVGRRSSNSPLTIIQEYETAHEQVMNLITQLAPETLHTTGLLPWYGPEYDLEDFIVYTSYAHKREHSAHIDAFYDHLTRQGEHSQQA